MHRRSVLAGRWAIAIGVMTVSAMIGSASDAHVQDASGGAGAAASAQAMGVVQSVLKASASCREPELFGPGVFSTDKWEWRLAFTPNGRTAYWSVSDTFFPITGESTMVTSRFEGGTWTPPEVVPFSGTYGDIDPFITLDGRTMFFSSNRPVNGESRKADLWMVTRTRSGAWGEPVHLGPEVNSAGDDLYPSVDIRGTLYFGSDRGGEFDIWRSRRRADGTYGPPENVGPGVNSSTHWEYNPLISPDGHLLLFASLNRPGGYGFGDVYASALWNGRFTTAVNLGPCVNTFADEYHPVFSPDFRSLFFVRTWDRPGDFYRLRLW